MLPMTPKRALVLAPHTDDGEFGCGGTIAKLIERGVDVFYMAFSVCEQSVPYGFREDELKYELMAATEVLGIAASNVLIYRYSVRRFPEARQEILQDIIDIRGDLEPDLVFMPCLGDIHQDHQVVAHEGLRAFKNQTILCYEMPWNNLSITTSAFVVLEERHLAKKIEALQCYKTQAFRHYANEEFIRALARTRGAQIAVNYAEVYELARLII